MTAEENERIEKGRKIIENLEQDVKDGNPSCRCYGFDYRSDCADDCGVYDPVTKTMTLRDQFLSDGLGMFENGESVIDIFVQPYYYPDQDSEVKDIEEEMHRHLKDMFLRDLQEAETIWLPGGAGPVPEGWFAFDKGEAQTLDMSNCKHLILFGDDEMESNAISGLPNLEIVTLRFPTDFSDAVKIKPDSFKNCGNFSFYLSFAPHTDPEIMKQAQEALSQKPVLTDENTGKKAGRKTIPSEWEDMTAESGVQNDKDFGE